MKRKADSEPQGLSENGDQLGKKRATSIEMIAPSFADGLLEKDTLEKYKAAYATSGPYKHGVIFPLINDDLLRSVRNEIQEHISFTEKETDIYKIFQSGDLANLDGLDDESLSRLPSLLKLRNALYSGPFREYLSEVTGAGKLSGSKTDMAVNVYTGGCHLLCHDDVIGSRRVSYILYLTDPDVPWKPEWGGALRLFPTTTETNADGEEIKIPKPDYTVSIPPAFNQLSFFAVQPGESFHDVEEVYHMETKGSEKEIKSRVRMAISGWFHIPQEGEDGYEEGLAEKLAERSSLQQLQGEGDEFDRPQPQFVSYKQAEETDTSSKGKAAATAEDDDGEGFNDKDLDFLLKYIAPSYLTPDVASQLNEIFDNDRIVRLEKFLSEKFTPRLRAYIESQEKDDTFPTSAEEIEQKTEWKVSRPPHKHRYLYQQPSLDKNGDVQREKTPIQELLEDLLPSRAFKKWLSVVTGLDGLLGYNHLARRFRRGQDYTLASGYEGESPRLEFTIGITPTSGWEKEEEDEEETENADKPKAKETTNGQAKPEAAAEAKEEDPSVGGYEIYMAGDDDEDENEDGGAAAEQTLGSTGSKSKVNKSKADPAIYKSSTNDEDDGILFSMAAGWNRMSIVLRDQGPLKFVKYVSRAAKGDRWDITGEIDVEYDDEDDEDKGDDD
ncbi:putative component of NuA3 histone acetyltransferase complex [Microsporum canis]|uniref:uS12 prolyl 3,4-dihydroxylase n=1 Tax=Arthroderma otae (strain ATCC MYA-4605 / CBS 113480) TaxID=554155 RepID=C5FYT2_ARTOC|nr:2-oxoglutarate and Fe(II) dioxygenase domain containing protein 1 [Microsporum canis CBS 113480]EEQ34680.1 2-oxoglutarate and Fe(II) dioxygenase domain containing protein 1 [Microsporum canis CBS 113480]